MLFMGGGALIGKAYAEDGLKWEGNDPFHQPVRTTDYYGSGDANNDGVVTENDLLVADEMANGYRTPVSRADVDGNGEVDAVDVGSISNALQGISLPAWWNSLTNREQRNAWIDKMLLRDNTSGHPFRSSYQCIQFALQFFIKMAHYRQNLSHAPLTGGQTVYNLPVYVASISAPGFGHAINAILVGEDPLKFEDWRFIEPQTDETVYPGAWDMPFKSKVMIYAPRSIFLGAGGASMDVKVEFNVETNGVSMTYRHPSLMLSRTDPESDAASNVIDRWSPRLVPAGDGYVFFDRYRDDLERATDVHVQSIALVGTEAVDESVTKAAPYSRLRDAQLDHTGQLFLLWSGKPAYRNGLILGTYDPLTRELIHEEVAVSNDWRILAARVRITTSGVKHVFWSSNWGLSQGPGIYWARVNDEGYWTTPTNLTPDLFMFDMDRTFQNAFDAAVLSDDRLLLVWDHNRPKTLQAGVYTMVYDGATWEPSSLVEGSTNQTTHLALGVDSVSRCHLAFARDGVLRHRQYDGFAWTEADVVSSNGTHDRPYLFPGTNEEVYAVWRNASNRVDFACQIDGRWVGRTNWSMPDEGMVENPSVVRLPGGDVVLAWTAVNNSGATLQTRRFSSDKDSDRMLDFWEMAHDLDPAQSVDAADDPDGDGLSNAGEYLQGGDPRRFDTDGDGVRDGDEFIAGTGLRNPGSYLSCTICPAASDGAWELTWSTVSGRVYTVYQNRDALTAPQWEPIAVVPSESEARLSVPLLSDATHPVVYRLEVTAP